MEPRTGNRQDGPSPRVRDILAGVVMTIGVLGLIGLLFPRDGSPGFKLRSILVAFDSQKPVLSRLCADNPLPAGDAILRQVGVEHEKHLFKWSNIRVKVLVTAPAPHSFDLVMTLPAIKGDLLHAFFGGDVVPAGAALRSRGICHAGRLHWGPLESSILDRLEAAVLEGVQPGYW